MHVLLNDVDIHEDFLYYDDDHVITQFLRSISHMMLCDGMIFDMHGAIGDDDMVLDLVIEIHFKKQPGCSGYSQSLSHL